MENVGHLCLSRTYKLNCKVLKNDKPFIEGVQELIDDLNLKAFVMGTRRGDPNGAEQVSRFVQDEKVTHVHVFNLQALV